MEDQQDRSVAASGMGEGLKPTHRSRTVNSQLEPPVLSSKGGLEKFISEFRKEGGHPPCTIRV